MKNTRAIPSLEPCTILDPRLREDDVLGRVFGRKEVDKYTKYNHYPSSPKAVIGDPVTAMNSLSADQVAPYNTIARQFQSETLHPPESEHSQG